MIHYMFSIYDSKAGAYLPPFILPRTEMAQRTFGDCVNAGDHQFHHHPDDYTLFRLGTWDDETARFIPEDNGPQTLGNGVEYVRITDETPATEGRSNGEIKDPTQVGNET